MEVKDIIEKIRKGEIDINNQELFFSILIKGLMLKLNEDISIRGIPVPHMVIHTGSDALYLEKKSYDQSIEPLEISNENYIYNITPRCIVNPGGIDLIADQMTNPYSFGQLQYDSGDNLYNLVGEFRRLPFKLTVELKYFTDSYRDLLELIQQTLTNLAFIRTYYITYMGQQITCSYKIPEAFSGEHITELDGKTQDDKCHTLPLTIEVETNLPVFAHQTIMNADSYIHDYEHRLYVNKVLVKNIDELDEIS
jgi:hypothetical protein